MESIYQKTGSNSELEQILDHVRELQEWISPDASLNIEEFYDYATVLIERFLLKQHSTTVGRLAGETPYRIAENISTLLDRMDNHLLDALLECDQSADLRAVNKFAEILKSTDKIITFNYDCLIERCLDALDKKWSFGLDDQSHDSIEIFKLHGSMDWLLIGRDVTFKPDMARLIFRKKDINRITKSRTVTGEDEYDFQLLHIHNRESLLHHVKGRSLFQFPYKWGLAGLGPRKRPSLVAGLGIAWEKAKRALFEANEIFVVGFSFSQYDRFAQIEFADAMAGRAKDGRPQPVVTLIDPCLANSSTKAAQALMERVGTVFRDVQAVGVRHENYHWNPNPQ